MLESMIGNNEIVYDGSSTGGGRVESRGEWVEYLEKQYSAKRAGLEAGDSVVLDAVGRYIILKPVNDTPETGEVPNVDCFIAEPVSDMQGIDPDKAVRLIIGQMEAAAKGSSLE